MVKICICGAFRLWDKPKGGQEIKTCILADALEKKYGDVFRIDTLAPHSRIKMPFQLLWAMITCTDIIILPAHNGVVVLSKLLVFLNKVFRKRLHYSVIGGWLQDLLAEKSDVKTALCSFCGIYVETQTMMRALQKLGLSNVYIVPNCKPLNINSSSKINLSFCEPYKLVTFSRVTEKKGIGIAADVVMDINKRYAREIFSLDIYGPIDKGEDEVWFAEQRKNFTSSITYKGNVPFYKSVEILSDYFALLFPTRYFTEGIPGTIIDSYAAGVPVISSKWKSFEDVVAEGITGFGYVFDDKSDLIKVLEAIMVQPSIIYNLRINCIKKAENYIPENAIIPLCQNIDSH